MLEDTPLLVLHPPERVRPAALETARAAFQVAAARSPHQDVEFSVQQLTEMAVRALSPGTNDPHTAINALDDLSSGLARLATRETPSRVRADDSGKPRVYSCAAEPIELVTGVVDNMRWYAASSPSVMHATLTLIDRVGSRAHSPSLRTQLIHQVALMGDTFVSAGHHAHDVRSFEAHAAEVNDSLTSPRRSPLAPWEAGRR